LFPLAEFTGENRQRAILFASACSIRFIVLTFVI
jgi:hypothetical protein